MSTTTKHNIGIGGGRPPTDPATHRQRHTVTLTPATLATIAAYQAQHNIASLSATIESMCRLVAQVGGEWPGRRCPYCDIPVVSIHDPECVH